MDDAPDIRPDMTEDGRWMTYAQIADLRGISKASAERLVRRHRWRRQADNEGRVRAYVPLTWADQAQDDAPDIMADIPPDIRPDTSHAINALQTAIGALQQQLDRERDRADRAEAAEARSIGIIDGFRIERDAERARADRAEQGREGERSRADVLRDRIDAMQEQIATAAAVGEALQAERDQARREAQEAAAWRARSLLARLRTAWRGE
jgi:hypothetical protein